MRLENETKKEQGKENKITSSDPSEMRIKRSGNPNLHAQNIVGNHSMLQSSQGVIQRKLKIGAPNDKYEQEADRVADTITRDERNLGVEKNRPVQISCKTNSASGESEVSPELESQINSLKGKGKPLPDSTKAFFEPYFGDLSIVRSHSNSNSTKLADSINAEAFTFRNDIVFRSDQQSFESASGRRLLAHELTHVFQNNGLSVNRVKLKEEELPEWELQSFTEYYSGEGFTFTTMSDNSIRIETDFEQPVFCTKEDLRKTVLELRLKQKFPNLKEKILLYPVALNRMDKALMAFVVAAQKEKLNIALAEEKSIDAVSFIVETVISLLIPGASRFTRGIIKDLMKLEGKASLKLAKRVQEDEGVILKLAKWVQEDVDVIYGRVTTLAKSQISLQSSKTKIKTEDSWINELIEEMRLKIQDIEEYIINNWDAISPEYFMMMMDQYSAKNTKIEFYEDFLKNAMKKMGWIGSQSVGLYFGYNDRRIIAYIEGEDQPAILMMRSHSAGVEYRFESYVSEESKEFNIKRFQYQLKTEYERIKKREAKPGFAPYSSDSIYDRIIRGELVTIPKRWIQNL